MISEVIIIQTIQDDIEKLTKYLISIKKQGWINSHSKTYASGGLLFEKLIGKEVENFELPDFGNFEIKTKSSIKEEYITLFNATPDRNLFEVKRIRDLYGYPDYKNKKFKVFNQSFYCNKFTRTSDQNSFYLSLDDSSQNVILYHIDNFTLDKEIVTSWTFELLEEKLIRKLKYMLFVKARKKLTHNELDYKFTEYTFFELKNSKAFFNLLKEGKIRISFHIGVFYSGKRYGQIHDHGTGFEIEEDSLSSLFNKLPY